MKRAILFLSPALAVFVAACDPQVEHSSGTTSGAGGAGGAGGGSAGPFVCQGPLQVLSTTTPLTQLLQSSPRIAAMPGAGRVFYSFINGPPGTAASLYGMDFDAFSAWPPLWGAANLLDLDVSSQVMGPGPSGPVGLLHHQGKAPTLVKTFTPTFEIVDAPVGDNGDSLLVTALPDRYFWAETSFTGNYHVLHVGSYQPQSLPQSEEPLLCTTTPHLGRAVASGDGFLAAFLEPNPPEPACDPASPKAGTTVSLSHYGVPAGPGTFLARSQAERFVMAEPVVNLGLERASFGAWVVFQTDGSTSETAPPIVTSRVDPEGHALVPGGEMIALSPPGFVAPALATASLGDTLAAAWIDNVDPSAPTIVIQLVYANGSLGPAASIPTNDAWYEGSLQLSASNDGRSLLVAWEPKAPKATAFARVDCALGQ